MVVAAVLLASVLAVGIWSANRGGAPGARVPVPTFEEVLSDWNQLAVICQVIDQPAPSEPANPNRDLTRTIYDALVAAAGDPDNAEKTGRLGMAYHAHDMADLAAAAYERASELAPKEFRWAYYAACAAKDTDDLENAIKGFERALQLKADYPPTHLNLGDLYSSIGEYDKAKAAYGRYVTFRPTDPLGYVGLGLEAQARGDAAVVIRHMQDAIKYRPLDFRALYALGTAYRDQGDSAKADHYLRQSRQVPKLRGLDDRLLAEMSALNVTTGAYKRRFAAALAHNDLNDALKALTTLVEREPDRLEHWLRLADVSRRLRRLGDAERAANRAISLDANATSAYVLLALTYGDQQQFEAGRQSIDFAVHLDPDSGRAWAVRANLCNALGQRDEALRSLREALRCSPDNPGYWSGTARLLLEKGDLAEAAEALEKCVELQPADRAARERLDEVRSRMAQTQPARTRPS